MSSHSTNTSKEFPSQNESEGLHQNEPEKVSVTASKPSLHGKEPVHTSEFMESSATNSKSIFHKEFHQNEPHESEKSSVTNSESIVIPSQHGKEPTSESATSSEPNNLNIDLTSVPCADESHQGFLQSSPVRVSQERISVHHPNLSHT